MLFYTLDIMPLETTDSNIILTFGNFSRDSFHFLQAGQPELIALEKALKAAMNPAGTAREVTPYTYFYPP